MSADEDRRIGITTTIPVEVVLASGLEPVDLNNIFVSSRDPDALIDLALADGFPQAACAWLKGIYGAVVSEGGPERVIGVVRGDCSGTEVLLEALELRGLEVIPFSYPFPPRRDELKREMEKLASTLGTTLEEARSWKKELAAIRSDLVECDRLCWQGNRVSGLENHLWLVSSSDFWGDPGLFGGKLRAFLDEAARRPRLDGRDTIPFPREVRLGYVGVPPIVPQIFGRAEELGARFVFHEVQRQFSMPDSELDLVDAYLAYTYPYTVKGRAVDIDTQARTRGLDGIVHYVQSFCHRNLENLVFARTLDWPLLNVETDCPGTLGATAMTRLENFIQVLGENI